MLRSLNITPEQKDGAYREVLEFLYAMRLEYGSAANAAAQTIRSSPRFQRWQEQRNGRSGRQRRAV